MEVSLDYNAFIRVCKILICLRGRRSLVFPCQRMRDADEDVRNLSGSLDRDTNFTEREKRIFSMRGGDEE